MPRFSKLTEGDVRLIRQLHAQGVELRAQANALTIRALAAKWGVAPSTVHDVVYYKTFWNVR